MICKNDKVIKETEFIALQVLGPPGKEWDPENRNVGIWVYLIENTQVSDPLWVCGVAGEATFPWTEGVFHHLETIQIPELR